MTPTRDDLLFAAEVSCRYHQRRASFLKKIDSIINYLTVLTSGAAFATLIGGSDTAIAKYATAIVAVLGVSQIIFGIGRASYDHENWHKRWKHLTLEIQTTPQPTDFKIKEWLSVRHAIESEYIAELRSLEVDCRNDAIRALQLEEDEIRIIRWYQKPILHLVSLQTEFPKHINPTETPQS